MSLHRKTRSLSATTKRPTRYTVPSGRVTRTLLPLLLLVVTGCCGGRGSRAATDPGAVLVDPVSLRSCDAVERALGLSPGALRVQGATVDCYVASGGWLIRRMEVEQGLEAALLDCREED
jgi:hypothetical protein